jgi:hypothetical protein
MFLILNRMNGEKILSGYCPFKRCLSIGRDGQHLSMESCDETNENMKWTFQETKPSWAT